MQKFLLDTSAGLLGLFTIMAAQVYVGVLEAPLFIVFFWCLVCSRYLGRVPAILIILCSTAASNIFFLAPYRELSLRGPAGLLSTIFLTASLLSLSLIQSILKYGRLKDELFLQERQIAEKNLALAETLKDAVTARDNFLAVAGHELRTPLTALYLHTQIWQRRAEMHVQNITGEKLQNCWKKQLECVECIVKLVEQLLDVSKIDRGSIVLNYSTFNVSDLCEELLSRFSSQLNQVGCEVSVHGAPNLLLHWDRTKLDQILSNLINNAIKYAPGNPLQLHWAETEKCVVMALRDSGPGIDKDDQDRIFDRYHRLENGQHNATGLGIGLWLSREMLQAGSGTLEIQSEASLGSSFIIKIPKILDQSEPVRIASRNRLQAI